MSFIMKLGKEYILEIQVIIQLLFIYIPKP
jgi:hypothetical protein